MYTVTLEQVKEVFVETFCSGCSSKEFNDCERCEINKNSAAFFIILENLAIINNIDETLNNKSIKGD